jgi:hypothetical protein
LNGCSYERLHGIGEEDTGSNLGDWHARYLTNWLDRDTSYTPQPYEQLAAVFRSAGEPAKAFDVLFASRERARGLTKKKRTIEKNPPGLGRPMFPGWRYIGLTLLKLTIGYGLGYRYFWSLAVCRARVFG